MGMPESPPSSKFSGLEFITISIFSQIYALMNAKQLTIHFGLVYCLVYIPHPRQYEKKHKQTHSQGLIWERRDYERIWTL